MRPIYFVKTYRNEKESVSAEYAATKATKVLREYGVDASSVRADASRDIKGSLIVHIKKRNNALVKRWKENGNIVIYWLDDGGPDRCVNLEIYDAVIFPNEHLRSKYSIDGQNSTVIHHFTDNAHGRNIVPDGVLKIGYFGLEKNCMFLQELDFIDCVFDRDMWYERSCFYNCHYSVRDSWDSTLKPNTKLAVAASCMSALVTGRDPALIGLLPLDYPYYTDRTLQSVRSVFSNIFLQFERKKLDEWEYAIECIRQAAKRLCPARISQDYIEFFKKVER
jgi:hypothetical protein